MTEVYAPSHWQRFREQFPHVLKVRAYPGTLDGYTRPSYDEWILAWGGKWRWRIRREPE